MRCFGNRRIKGFTLMEVLVVVAIIAVLTAVCIPVVSGARDKAMTATCAANRRALLGEVSIMALTDDRDARVVFEELYPSAAESYKCPKGGTFSWSEGKIICSKHSEDTGVSAVSVGDGRFPAVLLDADIDDTPRVRGDTITVKKGQIYKIGDSYYVGTDNYSPRTVTSDNYESFLVGTYTVKKVNFDKVYSQEQLGTDGLLNGYSGTQVGIGSVYRFNGRLYVQSSGFTGNTPKQSSDPTVNPDYWTLLGTIE